MRGHNDARAMSSPRLGEPAAEPLFHRIRWGGALLVAGALLAVAANVLDLTLPPLRSYDASARAAQLVANAAQVRWTGYTGMFADALLAMGAWFLSARSVPNRARAPGAAWLAVALGSLLGMAVFALFGTGYLALATTHASNPGVFQAALLTMAAFAGLGSLATGAGALLVFLAEATTDRCAIARPVSALGAVGAACVLLEGVAYLTGLTALLAVSYGAFLLFAGFLVLGYRLFRLPLGVHAEADVAEPGPTAPASAGSSQRRRHNG